MIRLEVNVTPAAEGHGLCPWMNAPTYGRDVAPPGREDGATGYARGAPRTADSDEDRGDFIVSLGEKNPRLQAKTLVCTRCAGFSDFPS